MKKRVRKSRARIVLAIISYFTVLVVSVLIISEVLLRIGPENRRRRAYTQIMKPRLWAAWLSPYGDDPLVPPFKVFANRDFDDLERLRFVASESGAPGNTTFMSWDFLRPAEDREKTRYTATINSLGYRDPPRSAKKPENVFRIIALGSYQTFGHAVDDRDAYPQQLERILNARDTSGLKYEVWNGGRHAGSAIVGWAKLRTEVMEYDPDLIIWDYGDVDAIIVDDNNFPMTLRFPDTGVYRPISRALEGMKGAFEGESYLPAKLVDYSYLLTAFSRYLAFRNLDERVEACREVYMRMIETTKSKNIPVILLRQTKVTKIPDSFYIELSEPFSHVYLVDTRDSFRKYPPSEELRRQFNSGYNWSSEFGSELNTRTGSPAEYATDFMGHHNKFGIEAIASDLAEHINRIRDERSNGGEIE